MLSTVANYRCSEKLYKRFYFECGQLLYNAFQYLQILRKLLSSQNELFCALGSLHFQGIHQKICSTKLYNADGARLT